MSVLDYATWSPLITVSTTTMTVTVSVVTVTVSVMTLALCVTLTRICGADGVVGWGPGERAMLLGEPVVADERQACSIICAGPLLGQAADASATTIVTLALSPAQRAHACVS